MYNISGPFLGVHWWQMDFPHKGPAVWKRFLCHNVIMLQIEGILPKGPYLPCVGMADMALLTGYHSDIHTAELPSILVISHTSLRISLEDSGKAHMEFWDIPCSIGPAIYGPYYWQYIWHVWAWSSFCNFTIWLYTTLEFWHYIDGLVQDCSMSIVNALEIQRSYTKSSICNIINHDK